MIFRFPDSTTAVDSIDQVSSIYFRKSIRIERNEHQTIIQALLPEDPDEILDLVTSYLWPEAVPQSLMVKDHKDIRQRSYSIIGYYVGDLEGKRFLDFGCGDGSCVSAATNIAKEAWGYDIKRHSDWENRNCSDDIDYIIDKGPFDIIMLYDVIDHITESLFSDTINKIRHLCNKHTQILVRCHPWSSIHGGHLYNKANKAFLHWFTPDEDYESWCEYGTNILTYPLDYYGSIFNNAGLIVRSIQENFISNPKLADIMLSEDVIHYILHRKYQGVKFTADSYFPSIHREYIDYVLSL